MVTRKNIYFLLIAVILTSCSCDNYFDQNNYDYFKDENNILIDEKGCIQSTINYAYNINIPSEIEIDSFPKNILPAGLWEKVVDFPEELDSGDIVYTYQYEDDIEIWIKDRNHHSFAVDNLNFTGEFSKYWIYSISQEKWDSISAITSDGKAFANTLFTTQKRDLYAVNLPIIASDDDFPLISKFDRKKRIFIPLDKINELSTDIVKQPNGVISLVDSIGTLWLLVDGDGIYSLEISSNTLQKQFVFSKDIFPGLENFSIRNAKIGDDNKIYFLFYSDLTTTSTQVEYPLYIYDTQEKSIGRITPQLSPWPLQYTSFLLDSKGNIWFDNVGWVDSEQNWNQLFPSPIFISLGRSSVYTSRLSPARVLLESSDHVLWFHHDNGMMYLDPSEEEWCWFTTVQSNIVEDSEQNLWMIADRQLYKKEIDN